MPDDRSFHVLEAVPNRLEASPQRPRRRWSAEAKSRLIEATLKPGANVSAIARQAGMAPAQLFGWRSKAIKSGAVTPQRDADRLGFVEVTQAARRRAELGRLAVVNVEYLAAQMGQAG
ncbi:transposase, partial [Mesorhizobium sp. WSM3876]|uniref:transposase n=2 Tax=Mesorhizobium TaxID=68287 RepID=UPI001FE07918